MSEERGVGIYGKLKQENVAKFKFKKCKFKVIVFFRNKHSDDWREKCWG